MRVKLGQLVPEVSFLVIEAVKIARMMVYLKSYCYFKQMLQLQVRLEIIQLVALRKMEGFQDHQPLFFILAELRKKVGLSLHLVSYFEFTLEASSQYFEPN